MDENIKKHLMYVCPGLVTLSWARCVAFYGHTVIGRYAWSPEMGSVAFAMGLVSVLQAVSVWKTGKVLKESGYASWFLDDPIGIWTEPLRFTIFRGPGTGETFYRNVIKVNMGLSEAIEAAKGKVRGLPAIGKSLSLDLKFVVDVSDAHRVTNLRDYMSERYRLARDFVGGRMSVKKIGSALIILRCGRSEQIVHFNNQLPNRSRKAWVDIGRRGPVYGVEQTCDDFIRGLMFDAWAFGLADRMQNLKKGFLWDGEGIDRPKDPLEWLAFKMAQNN